MAKFRSLKNSFIGGEISNSALGRTDLSSYVHSCKILRNAIPLLSGGAYRRPGTVYGTYLSSVFNYVPRLFPFVYSQNESYLFWNDSIIGGINGLSGIRAQQNDDMVSGASFLGTIPYIPKNMNSTVGYYDEIWDVHTVQSADVMWLVHPSYKPRKIYRLNTDSFRITEFNYDSSGTAFTGIKARDAWPYLPQNTTAITLQIDNAAVGTGRTLTASSGFFNSSHGPSTVGGTDGAVFKVNNAGTYGFCRVTQYQNSTTCTVEVIVAFGAAATPVTTWWEGAWSDYRGWPRSVCFYGGRLVMGGTSYQPDTLFFSETSDYDQFSKDSRLDPGVANGATGSEAFTATLASNQLNQIQWLNSESTLLVGTSGDEWIIDFDRGNSTGLGADNIYTSVTSRYGSSHIQAVRAGNEVFFVSGTGDEVRALVFNDSEKSYVAEPLQILYDEFPSSTNDVYVTGERKIRQITWDESRKTLWCVDTAGNVRGLTRERRLQISCWHSHELGGFDSTETSTRPTISGVDCTDPAYVSCSGSVLSVMSLPNTRSGGIDVWFVVKRKINGVFLYVMERIIGKNPGYDSAYVTPLNGPGRYFVDCAIVTDNGYAGSPLSEPYTFSGAGVLEGKSVVGTASGYAHGMFKVRGSVSAGAITMTGGVPPSYANSSYVITWGLPYTTIIQPVRVEAGSQIGSSFGAIQRVHQATIRLFRTIGCKIGSSSTEQETLIFRKASDPMGKSAELFTGEKTVKLSSDYDKDGSLYITQEDPLPFCVVSVSVEGMTAD